MGQRDRSRSRGRAPDSRRDFAGGVQSLPAGRKMISTNDRGLLRDVLQRKPEMSAYLLGDLADPFFQQCTWTLLVDATDAETASSCRPGAVLSVALVYFGLDVSVFLLHALDPDDVESREAARQLMGAVQLPEAEHFECHIDCELVDTLMARDHLDVKTTRYVRMYLGAAEELPRAPPSGSSLSVRRLCEATDGAAAKDLSSTMPRTWFEPHVLTSGMYFGIYEDDGDERRLVSMAGTHVFAPSYAVAAVGNVCTHPAAQRRGLARVAMCHLCAALRAAGVSTIALNVEKASAPAINLYRRLGFGMAGAFIECDVHRRQHSRACSA